MRPIAVVETKGTLERSFDLFDSCEVSTAELDPPVFVQKRPLNALDEAVRELMTRFGASVPDAKLSARLREVALELTAAVAENSPERPARPIEIGVDLAEELGRDRGSPRKIFAQMYNKAVSQAVICQTLPTPLSLPT
jgi:hypothetical protein